jgi:hypothetical protein
MLRFVCFLFFFSLFTRFYNLHRIFFLYRNYVLGRLPTSHGDRFLTLLYKIFVSQYTINNTSVGSVKSATVGMASMLEMFATQRVLPLIYKRRLVFKKPYASPESSPPPDNVSTSVGLYQGDTMLYDMQQPSWLTHVNVMRSTSSPVLLAVYGLVRERECVDNNDNDDAERRFGAPVDTSSTARLPSTVSSDRVLRLQRDEATRWRTFEAAASDINAAAAVVPHADDAMRHAQLAGLPRGGAIVGASLTSGIVAIPRSIVPRWFFEDDNHRWTAMSLHDSAQLEKVRRLQSMCFFF